MEMINSMMGSLAEEAEPVSPTAVELGVPDRMRNSVHDSHAYIAGQTGSGVGVPSSVKTPPLSLIHI